MNIPNFMVSFSYRVGIWDLPPNPIRRIWVRFKKYQGLVLRLVIISKCHPERSEGSKVPGYIIQTP
jgi:hypothetical protein